MNLDNEFQQIRHWAANKGIYTEGDIKTQTLKLQEEVGELAKAVLTKNQAEIEDAIGDCVVVLTNLAELSGGAKIEVCINNAYNIIKNRKGNMYNGTFIKNGNS